MALCPLPPSSNESVIDNGSNVWQMAMPIILVLSHNLSKQCCLSHSKTLPWRFSVHCEMNMETILHSRRTIRFLLIFLSFSAHSKADGRCRSTVLNWSECLSLPIKRLQLTWPSKANQYMRWIDCSRMHAPPAFFAQTCLRSRNDLRHFNLLEFCS